MEVTQDVEDKQLGEVPEVAPSKIQENREEMLSRHRLYVHQMSLIMCDFYKLSFGHLSLSPFNMLSCFFGGRR